MLGIDHLCISCRQIHLNWKISTNLHTIYYLNGISFKIRQKTRKRKLEQKDTKWLHFTQGQRKKNKQLLRIDTATATTTTSTAVLYFLLSLSFVVFCMQQMPCVKFKTMNRCQWPEAPMSLPPQGVSVWFNSRLFHFFFLFWFCSLTSFGYLGFQHFADNLNCWLHMAMC